MMPVTLLLHLSVIGAIAYLVSKREQALKRIFWPALAIKLLAGIALGLIYLRYYGTGDTLVYFKDGSTLAALAKNDPGAYIRFLWSSRLGQWPDLQFQDPRALFMVKIVSVFNLVSLDDYWTIALYFSFISFLGSWFLVRQIYQHFPGLVAAAALAFLFFPSVVFWSSGVIKESLAMASLFFLTGIFLKVWSSENLRVYHWLLLLPAAWILWNLKYYFAAIFFAVTVTSILYKFMARVLKPAHFATAIFVWLLVFTVPLGLAMASQPNFYPARLFGVIVENYQAYSALSSAEDLIHFKSLSPEAGSMMANAPWALFSGLFRPFLWEAHNIFQMTAAVENLFLFVLSCIVLLSASSVRRSHHRMLIFSTGMYILLLCVFITLSTPNFGTLSRYRAGYIPYFLFLLFCSPSVLRFLQSSFNRLVQYKR